MTDRRSLLPPSGSLRAVLRKVEAMVAAGVDWVQLREKDLFAKELGRLTRESLGYAGQAPARSVRILVNDRLDVAVAEHAGGVHLGEQSIPVAQARRFLKASSATEAGFLVGVSCHSLAAAQSAAQNGADYVFFGPVFATPSKAAYGSPQGLERLSEVCQGLSIPVLAIGGITVQNAGSCVAAGAAGIAGIRLFQDAPEPVELVAALHRL